LNVALISGFIANKLFPNNDEMVQILSIGGILHDIGKARIPSNILNKPGPLTNSEFEVMKKHTIYGEDLAKKFGVSDSRVLSIIRGHHERFSGNGYPDILDSEAISKEARIATVADVFDALTAKRVYKEPLECKEAITLMIEKMSTYFDPQVLRYLIISVGLYPAGSAVNLSDGSIGIVVGTRGEDLIRPQVMIKFDKNGKKVEDIHIIDLSVKNESLFIKNVIHDFGKIGF
jgi:HD-GYP domain-containing protein (c-di-GMP phosphodiesterase class II)